MKATFVIFTASATVVALLMGEVPATQQRPASAPATGPATDQAASRQADRFRIALKKVDDSGKVTMEGDAVVFCITCPGGIGSAQITRASGAWPAKVLIRLSYAAGDGFKYLEHFTADGGGEKFTASQQVVRHVRMVKKYAEIELPATVFSDKRAVLLLDWIDAYR
ncbi:MAG: hypothetical protein ACE15C_19900 [Phycisphaerae bacterium]